MSKKLASAVALGFLALSLSAMASPIGAPTKKLPGKHHPKMIPARHNAGRPNHP